MSAPTPLVLVHGNPECAAVWGPLLAELGRPDGIALSPPGFGVPVPPGFETTVEGYHRWLVASLEQFRRPVDLVGHDWGGIHVALVAIRRPDLIRSWASDALGVLVPDYVWHPRAQVWQQEGPGEESVAGLFGGTLEQRLAVVASLGMAGPTAEQVAAGMGPGMGAAVLGLLRSAVQPAMADAGRRLGDAGSRPGLAIIATADLGQASGTPAQHRAGAEASGAGIVELPVDHWWPVTDPAPVAEALSGFWSRLDGPRPGAGRVGRGR